MVEFRKLKKEVGFLKEKIRYYDDELNDDFLPPQKKTLVINGEYNYEPSGFFRKIAEFIVYRLIMVPIAFCYVKIKFRQKTVGAEKLKKVKKSGYFTYANHALVIGDAFIPNIVNLPKKTYTVVHPDNLSKRGLKTFLELNGAIPVPATFSATKNFTKAIEKRINRGNVVQIYPEAHVWDYYTGIRNFPSASFYYPAKFNAPVFAVTNTFKKTGLRKTPKVVTYVDGPFYPDESLTLKTREKALRDRVYAALLSRSKLSDCEYIKYVKRSDKND